MGRFKELHNKLPAIKNCVAQTLWAASVILQQQYMNCRNNTVKKKKLLVF
jgi:hypothetical protein